MKKYIAAAFVLAAFALSTAGAQTLTTTVNGHQQQSKQQKQAAVLPRPKTVGAFVRTAGDPIQLVNPRAPQRYYGRVEDTVVEGDNNPPPHNRGESVNRFAGVVLFGFTW